MTFGMLTIQIILLVFILFAVSRAFLKLREKKLSARWFLAWLIFWGAAAFFVARPNVASRLAALVGVTRGVDLAVYVAILVLFYIVFRILVKIEHVEQEITKVVREIALRNKEHNKP